MGLQDMVNWYNRVLSTRRARVAAISAAAACVLLLSVFSLSRLSSIDTVASVSPHLEPMQVPWQQLARPQEDLGPSQINRHFPSKARMVVRWAAAAAAAAFAVVDGMEFDLERRCDVGVHRTQKQLSLCAAPCRWPS
jgi:hypothetical protein